MEVRVTTKEFSKAISIASRFVSPRANLPILSNVVLKAHGNSLIITSTDLELSCVVKLGAAITTEGEIAAPAKTLHEIVSNLSSEHLTLSVDGETLHLKTEGVSSRISSLNTSDYPKITTEVSESVLSIDSHTLVNALDKVIFATSHDESRPILTGVLFLFGEENLKLVGTDGFRLSLKEIKLPGAQKEDPLIIPRRVLSELIRIAPEGPILFDWKKDQNQVVFQVGDITLTSRILEGNFPPFEKIIPNGSSVQVGVSKEEFSKAVKLSAVFARDSANVLKLKVEEKAIILTAESSRSGSQESEVSANVVGAGVTAVFNYKFLEEFLHSVSGESIDIKLIDATKPCIFLDPEDTNYLHLIMPARS